MDKRECMDCGTPFCHWGCPLGNFIPEWNEKVLSRSWKSAFELLNASNCLPEITGRICPAPCEFACVLGKNEDPMTIRENELAIIEYAFENGLIKPVPPKKRTGKRVAVIGSGPAGLSCAAELNKLGHLVTVFEKDEKPGGLLRYGIPDFKLDKKILDRRIAIWEAEGIIFKTGINVRAIHEIPQHDAVCLAIGSRVPRDLKVPGRDLEGIYFALDYLTGRGESAAGKKVAVIGGGDTGLDCVNKAVREKAKSVVQIEILPQPPADRIWPYFSPQLKEAPGAERMWETETIKFKAQNSKLKSLVCKNLITGEGFEVEAELVVLALGFLHPEHVGLLNQLNVEYDKRGNIQSIPNPKVFSAGDCRRGQSLIVWAVFEGRQAAGKIHKYLTEKV